VSATYAITRLSGNWRVYRPKEGTRNNSRVLRRRYCNPPYPIYHLAQQHLARDLQPPSIVCRNAIDILVQDHKVALGVAFEERVLGDVRDGRSPGGLEMARSLGQSVRQAVCTFFVGDDRDALHEIRDGDQVAGYGDVDGGGGGAIAGDFVERAVFECVHDDLFPTISVTAIIALG